MLFNGFNIWSFISKNKFKEHRCWWYYSRDFKREKVLLYKYVVLRRIKIVSFTKYQYLHLKKYYFLVIQCFSTDIWKIIKEEDNLLISLRIWPQISWSINTEFLASFSHFHSGTRQCIIDVYTLFLKPLSVVVLHLHYFSKHLILLLNEQSDLILGYSDHFIILIAI